jgi:hypothetical protein
LAILHLHWQADWSNRQTQDTLNPHQPDLPMKIYAKSNASSLLDKNITAVTKKNQNKDGPELATGF